MTDVVLATFQLCPEGEPGGELVVAALAQRGVNARWECWDDPDVDWAAADLVAVRATWDYHRRLDEFLTWSRSVERDTALLNGTDVFVWNADKSYLVELAERVPVVPTCLLGHRRLVPAMQAAIDRFGCVVIKPRTGASGIGVVIVESTEDPRLQGLAQGPWVVQPLVESVRTRGETSVFVLDGRAVSQVDKLPGAGEIRVHEFHGGNSRPVELDTEAASVAVRAMAEVADVLGTTLDYGRVDLMEYDGRLVVSEVELIEPGLYLDVFPGNAEPFADLVAARSAAVS